MLALFSAMAVALGLALSPVAVGTPAASDSLKTLAETGNPDAYAAAFGGKSLHKVGGSPVAFEYAVATPWQATANMLLGTHEFLAPHFHVADNGDVTLMVAPHLFVSGMVIKGAGAPDNFIVIKANGASARFDYSDDVAAVMVTN